MNDYPSMARTSSPPVFVLDRRGKPVMPTTQKRARQLLEKGRARIHKIAPFTIRIVDIDARNYNLPPLLIKIDPGSKYTGIAIVRLGASEASPVAPAWDRSQTHMASFELKHRGDKIHLDLKTRRDARRARRSRHCRYRKPRFLNRARAKGWLPPSINHMVNSTVAIARKLQGLIPISAIVIEDCKFDTQRLMDPLIFGVGYQEGSLYQYHVKEWLLENHGRKCAYCGAVNVPLIVEHVVPKAKGGTNRLSNLTVSCRKCNGKKGTKDLREFLANDPKRLATVLANLEKPLKGAAAMNSVRNALKTRLKGLGLPVYSASTAETKFNRDRSNTPKSHAMDAANVGPMSRLAGNRLKTVGIASIGHGQRMRQLIDKFGFPRQGVSALPKRKMIKGFVTGDFVKATVTRGQNKGNHVGRVTVRSSEGFYIKRSSGKTIAFMAKNAKLLQRGDGYAYSVIAPLTVEGRGL
jgi:5-methylcytosine-specific restriction endonuclease McrA